MRWGWAIFDIRKYIFATFKDFYCHIMLEWCWTTIQGTSMSLLSALETKESATSARVPPSQGWAPDLNAGLNFLHKIRCTGEPEALSSQLQVNSTLRSRSTRQDADLALPRVRTEAGRRRLLFRVVQSYNRLPLEIRDLSLKSFKREVLQYLDMWCASSGHVVFYLFFILFFYSMSSLHFYLHVISFCVNAERF